MSKAVEKAGVGHAPRSERFNIQAPARFRLKGEWKWRAGAVYNISKSGVLLRTKDLVQVEAAIEVRFALPGQMAGEGAAEVVCRGVVVRTAACPEESGELMIASRIKFSQLQRRTGGISDPPRGHSGSGRQDVSA